MMKLGLLFLFSLIFVYSLAQNATYNDYRIGVGIYDVTGPAAETVMMGYAVLGQRSHGIHLRLRSRAFIIEDIATSQRVVFVSNDLCMTFGSIKNNVTSLLQQKFGNLYSTDNVMISGIHTHSGPGGYSYYTLYDISTLGYSQGNYETVVNGIYNAIVMAHDNLSSGGRILINNGTLLNSNANRSPYSYQFNPPEEIAKYEYDVDKNMTLLRFQDQNGNDLGLISWFAVHGTAMNNTNLLISGDNKGYAAYEVELAKNPGSYPGAGPFVAAFAQSNEGDVTPNTLGAFCPDGSPCDPRTSTCPTGPNGRPRVESCRGIGPGATDYETTRYIGHNQASYALELFDNAVTTLSGPFGYIHTYVNIENYTVSENFTSPGYSATTCVASLGDSFAGGTTDGPGMFNFQQGTNTTTQNPTWNELGHILSKPTQEETDCQYPKPILLNTGGINFPTAWTASVVPLQIFRIGQLFILGVPGEFTTMAGRRLRNTVMDVLKKHGAADENSHVIIAGLSNEYTHYITTYEEYQIQRYEAASTLYGPHTLAAYQQEFSYLAAALATGNNYTAGPTPYYQYTDWTLIPDVIYDNHPTGSPFGSIETDVEPTYSIGEVANVTFWGANPRNNYMTQSTFLTVDVLNSSGSWTTVYVDGHWETKFKWKKHELEQSLVTIEWEIPPQTPAGTYRITHQGYYKDILTGRIKPYSGVSSSFTVTA